MMIFLPLQHGHQPGRNPIRGWHHPAIEYGNAPAQGREGALPVAGV